MASSALGSAASYTAGAIPVILTGTAAKGVIVAAVVVVAVLTAVALILKAIGFTAAGPAPGSCAAAWMSSTAIANGGGVEAGSLYSALQATGMRCGTLRGAPAVLAAGVVVGALACLAWI